MTLRQSPVEGSHLVLRAGDVAACAEELYSERRQLWDNCGTAAASMITLRQSPDDTEAVTSRRITSCAASRRRRSLCGGFIQRRTAIVGQHLWDSGSGGENTIIAGRKTTSYVETYGIRKAESAMARTSRQTFGSMQTFGRNGPTPA